jgi:DNA-binding MarR family transcriptional regulator
MKRTQLAQDVAEGLAFMKRLIGNTQGKTPKDMPTRAQIGVLMILAHEGALTLKDIAERLCMSSSAATQLIDSLVKDKIIARTEDIDDRRKIRLSLTPAGRKRLLLAKKLYIGAFIKLLDPLTDTELLQWKKLQEKIIQHQKASSLNG